MQKNILIGVLGLSTLALAALSVHQHRRVRTLGAEQAEASSSVERPQLAPTAKAPAAPRPPRSLTVTERDAYEKQIADLQTRLETATATGNQEKSDEEEKPAKKPPMGQLAEMLKTPGMKDVIRAQQKGTMDITYASLYDYLKLPPEKLEAFKGLLLDRQMALMDVGLAMMDASLSDEEKKASAAKAAEIKKQFDEQIHAFLGEENAEVYDQFEDTQPERTQVHFFKQALAGSEPLTEAQEHDLITAMHEERKDFAFSTDFEDPANMGGNTFTEERIVKHMEELSALQERNATRAAGILNETQLKGFKASQEQQRSMQEMGLRMASQMFGSAPAKEKK